jgi:hypothetical protein
MSIADFDTVRMEHLFDSVAAAAGIGALFAKTRWLPEYQGALVAWRQAYVASIRLPAEVTIDFLKLAVRRELAAIKDGLQLSDLALRAIVRKWPDPKIAWAPIAIAAAQGKIELIRPLLDLLRKRGKRVTPLKIVQYGHWFPLLLWLMDDANGCDALSHFCGRKFTVDAYRTSRKRLKLPSFPQAMRTVHLRDGRKLLPEPDVWLSRKLKELVSRSKT